MELLDRNTNPSISSISLGYIFRLFVVFHISGCRHLESSDRSGILESSGHFSIKISNTDIDSLLLPICLSLRDAGKKCNLQNLPPNNKIRLNRN
jgi:hypothetical protein